MNVRWLTAFLDCAPHRFDGGAAFWSAMTCSSLSTRRGASHEFATLLPAAGDAYLRVQRVDEGPGGMHLDLHVGDRKRAYEHAIACGARLVADRGHLVMASPAAMVFCLVGHHGEQVRPQPLWSGSSAELIDQLCIDVPAQLFDEECRFWAALTDWELVTGVRPEFAVLVRPAGMPLRLLLQRLGDQDPSRVASAHLDLACGAFVDAAVARHELLGAMVERREQHWTTMRDPLGRPYCLTARDPVTGVLER